LVLLKYILRPHPDTDYGRIISYETGNDVRTKGIALVKVLALPFTLIPVYSIFIP